MKYIHIFCEDSLRVCVAIVNKFLYFFVNDACDFLAEASGVTEVTSEEYFVCVLFVVDKSESVGHTELRNHTSCGICYLFDVLRRSCGYIVKY